MLEPKHKPADDEAASRIYPDMPNYGGSEAEFLAAIEFGVAGLDAGRTSPLTTSRQSCDTRQQRPRPKRGW